MTNTTRIPAVGNLRPGRRIGHQFHQHVLGATIVREQLHDNDVMIEDATGERVVRFRTERIVPAPNGRLTDAVTVVFPAPRLEVCETTRLVLGLPFRSER